MVKIVIRWPNEYCWSVGGKKANGSQLQIQTKSFCLIVFGAKWLLNTNEYRWGVQASLPTAGALNKMLNSIDVQATHDANEILEDKENQKAAS